MCKRVRYFFLWPLYIGNRYECPFCGGHFRRFLPGGVDVPVWKEKNVISGGYRSNVICPRCDSFDRERAIYLYIKNKTGLLCKNRKKLRILHVAPDRQLQRIFMSCPSIDYRSADISSPLAMDKVDIAKFKYEDNSFDVIICCHVLEHVPDDRKAMSELYRVLKPGGWAILQVPISLSLEKTYEDPTVATPKERERAFGQCDHFRMYGRDYIDRLESAGFSVDVYNITKEFGESFVNKHSLIKNEDIYICSKLKQENNGL